MANPLMSMMNASKFTITPEMKSQIKNLYGLYKSNPQQFINQAMESVPGVKNNPLLASVISGGGDPKQAVSKLLNNCGMSEDDFRNLLN